MGTKCRAARDGFRERSCDVAFVGALRRLGRFDGLDGSRVTTRAVPRLGAGGLHSGHSPQTGSVNRARDCDFDLPGGTSVHSVHRVHGNGKQIEALGAQALAGTQVVAVAMESTRKDVVLDMPEAGQISAEMGAASLDEIVPATQQLAWSPAAGFCAARHQR